MLRWTATLVVALVALIAAGDPAPVKPAWLWFGEQATAGQTVYFRKVFKAEPTPGVKARLAATCDNKMEVFLNGESIVKSSEWSSPVVADATGKLKDGENTFAVRATNTDGAKAGFIARLDLQLNSGLKTILVTDGSWKVSPSSKPGWQKPGFDDAAWATATVVGKIGDAPWVAVTDKSLTPRAPSAAVSATRAEKIKVKEGFKVELLYSVPKDQQGSWVSMCEGPEGCLIVSDQHGGLFRVKPPPLGATTPCVVEKLPVKLGEAQGLLWTMDSLYVVVNGHGKYKSGLYRVRSKDKGNTWGPVELLKPLVGEGEHGPHAVLAHPNGVSLVVLMGNHSKPPELNSSLVPRSWGEDHIVPRMWDSRGHAKGIVAPGGVILKTDLDGKTWELISCGYRNHYDAAFNRDGDLFTFDSDMEWDMNTPWYKPTRVYHAVSGSDIGWRSGSGNYPVYYPDCIPQVVDIGPGSPTGVCFGYGTMFPAKYQNALFCCDWSYGKLYAVHLTEEGSSYRGAAEEFLMGLPLPLTDIVANKADGALYFSIGGRKTTSGLYRVTFVGNEATTPAKVAEGIRHLRMKRRDIEHWHGRVDPIGVDLVWQHLGDNDRFMRYAARVVLEQNDSARWQERALAEAKPQAALTALFALAKVGDKALLPRIMVALGQIRFGELNHAQKLELLRVCEIALVRMGPAEAGLADGIINRLDRMFPCNDRELNSEMCKILCHLNAPSVAAKALDLIAKAPTQEEQMDYVTSLRIVTAGWTPALRKQYFEWFHRAAGFRGGHSFTGFVDMIKADAVAKLTDEQKVELQEVLASRPHAPPAPPKPRAFVKKWTVDELVSVVENDLKGRDFDRGRELFSATRCVACHRYKDEGGANGPDLTGAAGRFSVRDLLESTIEPSKVISDQYAGVTIVTDAGKTISGRLVNLNGDNLMINTDPFDPDAIATVNRNRVESMETSKISIMPDGLIDTCSADEIKDLVAYLLSKGDRNGPMFKKK